MKPKYKIGDAFIHGIVEQHVIVVASVWIPKDGRPPIYKLAHLSSSCGYYFCRWYGYYDEKELDALNYIEI